MITVVIPVYNENESLRLLMRRLVPILNSFGTFEIIFVNDGSSDGSEKTLDQIHKENPLTVNIVHLRAQRGKAVALLPEGGDCNPGHVSLLRIRRRPGVPPDRAASLAPSHTADVTRSARRPAGKEAHPFPLGSGRRLR